MIADQHVWPIHLQMVQIMWLYTELDISGDVGKLDLTIVSVFIGSLTDILSAIICEMQCCRECIYFNVVART